MKPNLLLTIGLLAVATGCANLSPQAATRPCTANPPLDLQNADDSAAPQSLLDDLREGSSGNQSRPRTKGGKP